MKGFGLIIALLATVQAAVRVSTSTLNEYLTPGSDPAECWLQSMESYMVAPTAFMSKTLMAR